MVIIGFTAHKSVVPVVFVRCLDRSALEEPSISRNLDPGFHILADVGGLSQCVPFSDDLPAIRGHPALFQPRQSEIVIS